MRRSCLPVLIVLTAIASASCNPKPIIGTSPGSNWWKFQRDLEQTGYEIAGMGPNPQLYWDAALVTGTTSLTPPVWGSQHIYIGSGYGDNKLYALMPNTGAIAWTFAAHPNNGFFGAPAAANDAVYAVTLGNAPHVYAVEQASGALIWQTPLPQGSRASVSVANGLVYVNTDQHRVYALSQITGTIIWNSPTSANTSSEESSPGIGFGRVYVGSDDALYTFSAITGAPGWQFPLTDITGFSSPVLHMNVGTGNPALVFISTNDRKLHAIQAVTGAAVWQYTGNATLAFSSVAVAHDKVFLFNGQAVTALDAKTGTVVWDQATPAIPRHSPAISGERLFYSDNQRIIALDVNTGAPTWTAPIPGNGDPNAPGNALAIAREIVVVPNKGHVYAFR